MKSSDQSAATGNGVADRRDTRARFEQWARNPLCEANVISAVRGVPMAEVAKREGLKPTMGQSPFAIAGGHSFERALFVDRPDEFVEALVEAGVLPAGSRGLVDLRLRMVGGQAATLLEAAGRTREILEGAARRPSSAPAVVVGAALEIPGSPPMLPNAGLAIDALAIRLSGKGAELVVGEVKTYPDRGGYTDRGDLAAARAQAGVYVHALDLLLEKVGLRGGLAVQRKGFLVLRKPGSRWPSIRANEDLRYQAERARRGFEKLREIARDCAGPAEGEGIESVLRAPVRYESGCVSFCDRAAGCYDRALEDGRPEALGEDVARLLGPIGLKRAVELLGGARPKGVAEQDFVRTVSESRRAGGRR